MLVCTPQIAAADFAHTEEQEQEAEAIVERGEATSKNMNELRMRKQQATEAANEIVSRV